MEHWDIYDSKREKMGYTVKKGDSLKSGEYHLVAHVCLFNREGKMLIQKRKKDKPNWPGKWDISAGGAAKAGENSNQAAERELYEELSIHIPLDEERPVITIHFDDGFDDYFIVNIPECELPRIKYRKKEIEEVAWVSRDQIKELVQSGDFDLLMPFIDLLFCMKESRGNHYSKH